MARTDALGIVTDAEGETKDKLAESYGKVIESIQKGALSEQLKNKDYSGDPTTGSVEVSRFKNAASATYGTARTASKGNQLVNSGKVTINLNTDKEIVEEIEEKDVRTFGVGDIIARRVNNHSMRAIADLDGAYFTALESAATAVTLAADVIDIEDVVEAMIQSIETVKNDWVDGVDRDIIALTLTPAAFGKLRNHIDKVMVENDYGKQEIDMFHGVRVYSNTRQTSAIIAQIFGAAGQPATFNEYQDEKIPLSNAHAVELFYSYGTGVVTPDLVKKLATLPTPPAGE
jgi:hypothetical protein